MVFAMDVWPQMGKVKRLALRVVAPKSRFLIARRPQAFGGLRSAAHSAQIVAFHACCLGGDTEEIRRLVVA